MLRYFSLGAFLSLLLELLSLSLSHSHLRHPPKMANRIQTSQESSRFVLTLTRGILIIIKKLIRYNLEDRYNFGNSSLCNEFNDD